MARTPLDTIATAFNKIGKTNGTTMPKSGTGNHDPAAWELFIAKTLERLAKQRKDMAQQQAMAEGLLGNTSPQPGTKETTYAGVVTITRSVSSPRSTLDTAKLRSNLSRAGMDSQTIDDVLTSSMKTSKAPVLYDAFVTSNNE